MPLAQDQACHVSSVCVADGDRVVGLRERAFIATARDEHPKGRACADRFVVVAELNGVLEQITVLWRPVWTPAGRARATVRER